jgi:hypothetical protein
VPTGYHSSLLETRQHRHVLFTLSTLRALIRVHADKACDVAVQHDLGRPRVEILQTQPLLNPWIRAVFVLVLLEVVLGFDVVIFTACDGCLGFQLLSNMQKRWCMSVLESMQKVIISGICWDDVREYLGYRYLLAGYFKCFVEWSDSSVVRRVITATV